VSDEVLDESAGAWGKATPEFCAQMRREALDEARARIHSFLYRECAGMVSPTEAAAFLEQAMALIAQRYDEASAKALAAHAARKAAALPDFPAADGC
jgi:hypothetical protein